MDGLLLLWGGQLMLDEVLAEVVYEYGKCGGDLLTNALEYRTD